HSHGCNCHAMWPLDGEMTTALWNTVAFMLLSHSILCTFFTCFFRWPDCVKCLGQCGQECGFSPVWIYLCLFRLFKSKNPFPQNGHQCLFSPLCHLKCTFSSTLLVNFLSQRLQWNGFSPVWIRMWASTSRFPLPHCWQVWILPLRCTRPCRLRPLESGKLFPQSVHEKGRRPV
uniref:Uncharacterized protein n=1 Tax=Seriola dumerili TaxID=41447 RepID=A0A3B4T4N7_SERDU